MPMSQERKKLTVDWKDLMDQKMYSALAHLILAHSLHYQHDLKNERRVLPETIKSKHKIHFQIINHNTSLYITILEIATRYHKPQYLPPEQACIIISLGLPFIAGKLFGESMSCMFTRDTGWLLESEITLSLPPWLIRTNTNIPRLQWIGFSVSFLIVSLMFYKKS